MSTVMSESSIEDYIPASWASLSLVKREHYRALAHYLAGRAMLAHSGEFSVRVSELLQGRTDGRRDGN